MKPTGLRYYHVFPFYAVIAILVAAVSFVSSRMVDEEASPVEKPVIDVLDAALRCANGPHPKVWSKVDAEAAIHYAMQALATARLHGGSMPHKLAWSTEAIATMAIVQVCWSERGARP